MAADIQSNFGVEPELIAGGGGIFDIHVDGQQVFSKHEVGRFDEDGEVIGLMIELMADRKGS